MLALDEAANISRVLGMDLQELMDLAVVIEESGIINLHNRARLEFQRATECVMATVTTHAMMQHDKLVRPTAVVSGLQPPGTSKPVPTS